MQDRISAYPGRVRLIPVPGQTNVYDMTLADSPTVEGTPLNKANLLSDATAALLGLTSDAVPDEATELLARGMTEALTRAKLEIVSYEGTGGAGVNNPTSVTFSFPPKLVIVVLKEGSSADVSRLIYVDGMTHSYGICGYNADDIRGFNIYASLTENTLSWYAVHTGLSSTALRRAQLNSSDCTYLAIALG